MELYNARIKQFEETSICPFGDKQNYVLRTKISDGFYLYQSFGYWIHEKYGDERINAHVSFIADAGKGVCVEWEPQYGPVKIWRQCSKDWRGKTPRGSEIEPRKHWHYEYVEDNAFDWSQLAVDEMRLKKMLRDANFEGIKTALMSWCDN